MKVEVDSADPDVKVSAAVTDGKKKTTQDETLLRHTKTSADCGKTARTWNWMEMPIWMQVRVEEPDWPGAARKDDGAGAGAGKERSRNWDQCVEKFTPM